MSRCWILLLGLCGLVYTVVSDPSAVVESGASSISGRDAKLLDLSKVVSKSKIDELFDFGSKKEESDNKDATREDSARARFFNVVKKTSMNPYEMLIDCLIIIIPDKIETLQELCDNLQILFDLRIQEDTIDFDGIIAALMNAIQTFLTSLQMAIQNLQAVAAQAAMAARRRRRRPVAANRRRNQIHSMLKQMLRNQHTQLQQQQRQGKDHKNPAANP